jgi:hypothetical protein
MGKHDIPKVIMNRVSMIDRVTSIVTRNGVDWC